MEKKMVDVSFSLDGIGLIAYDEKQVKYFEYRGMFYSLARQLRKEAEEELHKKFTALDGFCAEGNDWAVSYFNRAIDAALTELVKLNFFDLDTENYSESVMDYSPWEQSFSEVSAFLNQINQAEAEREEERAERTEAAGNSWEGGGFGLEGAIKGAVQAEALNLAGAAISGGLNAIGRSRSVAKNEEMKAEFWRDPATGETILNGIFETVRIMYKNFTETILKNNLLEISVISPEMEKKARTVLSNLVAGRVPQTAQKDCVINVLSQDPYNAKAYEYLLTHFSDTNGEIQRMAKYFFISEIEDAKTQILEDCFKTLDLSTEDAAKKSREILLLKAKEINTDGSEIVKRIDDALASFDLAARTVNGREFPTRDEAAKQKILCDFFKSLSYENSEEEALRAKKAISDKAAELGVSEEWLIEPLVKKLASFDLAARTVNGREFPTRDEAAKQKILCDFFKSLSYENSEEEALRAKKAISDKAAELGVSEEWLIEPLVKKLAVFDFTARCAYGIEFATREDAKAGLKQKAVLFQGIKQLFQRNCGKQNDAMWSSFLSDTQKSVMEAFNLAADDEILAFFDSTVLKNGKAGLLISKSGIYFINGSAIVTDVLKNKFVQKGFSLLNMKKKMNDLIEKNEVSVTHVAWEQIVQNMKPLVLNEKTLCFSETSSFDTGAIQNPTDFIGFLNQVKKWCIESELFK